MSDHDALLRALRNIRSKGFGFIKIELEGQLDREGCRNCNHTCKKCKGTGIRNLQACTVEGCNDGYLTCPRVGTRTWSENDCSQYMLSHLTTSERNKIIFSRFYDDRSVDSEYTFTVPLTIKGINVATKLITTFRELGDEIGSGINVAGAGMHIALLNDPAGNYEPSSDDDYSHEHDDECYDFDDCDCPAECEHGYEVHQAACNIWDNTYCGEVEGASDSSDQNHLDPVKLIIFKQAMSKLLPALYFLATPSAKARPLEYRTPQISDTKYSAISTRGGRVLEYRVFETCYQRPEMLLDYVQVIAKTLEFYANELPSGLPRRHLEFKIGYGGHLARMYMTVEQLKWLEKTLKYLKPENKTVDQLKHERHFTLTVEKLQQIEYRKDQQYLSEWHEYTARHKYLLVSERHAVVKRFADEYLDSTPSEAYIKRQVEQRIRPVADTAEKFIQHKKSQQSFESSVTI